MKHILKTGVNYMVSPATLDNMARDVKYLSRLDPAFIVFMYDFYADFGIKTIGQKLIRQLLNIADFMIENNIHTDVIRIIEQSMANDSQLYDAKLNHNVCAAGKLVSLTPGGVYGCGQSYLNGLDKCGQASLKNDYQNKIKYCKSCRLKKICHNCIAIHSKEDRIINYKKKRRCAIALAKSVVDTYYHHRTAI